MADCYTTFDETCGDGSGTYAAALVGNAPPPSATSFSDEALKWIQTLGGIGGSIYRTVESGGSPVVSGAPAGAARTPTPGNLTPAQSTGLGTGVIIVIVAILVLLGVRRR